ncbi:MAG: DUF1570 domain-containing protein [Planctomycetes bacterium]|nr:DUF1570 domain-containing protein [Planctomycetota bacterium]
MLHRPRLLFAAALSLVLSLGLQPLPPTAELPAQAAEALLLAKDGKKDEAFAKILEALERAPDDATVLQLAASYAHDAGHDDEALWYARLALDRVPPGKEGAKLVEPLTKLVASLDPLSAAGAAPTDAWAAALFDLAKTSSGRKLWVNAVDLLSRLEDSSLGDKAAAELGKIYANKAAVAVLLDSGLAVPLQAKRTKKTPEQRAKEDAKHATWDARWKLKGDNYTLESNMNLETVEAMAAAMEQMNRFYRKVFHVKERGGDTARVTIKLYRHRKEFDQHETMGSGPISPSVRGFFSPSELKVATYDHRTDGLGLSFTWSTLFHEASHQFTSLISADLVPGWLNEGTASYFEGARLLANGTIETNLVPEGRLRALKSSLDAIETSSRGDQPTLKDVVSYYQPGSYEGSYYPYGWGLVYFLHNYEDANCVRPYVPLYQDYVASYKTGGKHDPFERFCEFFITRAKQPGIESFGQFEHLWQQWIKDLADLYFGPPARADELIARARKQRDAKQSENAIESYRWALRKRPGDALANVELAELFVAAKDKDRALYHYRAALDALAAVADPETPVSGGEQKVGELSTALEAKLVALDRDFAAGLAAARTKFAALVEERAKSYVEKGYPRAALTLLEAANHVDGASAARAELRDGITAETDVALERWRRLPLGADLAGWDASEAFSVQDGALVGKSPGLSMCQWNGELAPHYRFEVRMVNAEREGVWGVQYSVGANGTYLVGFFPDGHAQLVKLTDEMEYLGALAPVEGLDVGDFVFAIERFEDRFDFFVDGKKAGSRPATGDELSGGIGVFQQGAKVRFSDLRILQE